MVKPSILLLLTSALFFPAAFSFFHETPRAFVTEVIVPWCTRSRILHQRGCEHNDARCDLPPAFDRAALRYEREIGIPRFLFREWVSFMLRNDEDGDIYHRQYEQIVSWGSGDSVCIEGGDFDWLQLYCRMVHGRIRETKETIFAAIESTEMLALPSELEAISRCELLDSHAHDELFLNSLAMIFENENFSFLPWETRIKLEFPRADFFVSIRCIRTEYYFPYETWKNHAVCKDLHSIFDFEGLFETSSYHAVQKHLVKHLDEWRLNLDSIPKLYKEIAVPLLKRSHGDGFISKGAMELSPKELLLHESEAILDMQFEGLNDLNDTPRVKVLRTEREVQDTERALNTTLFRYSALAIPSWGANRDVAVALCDAQGDQVAVGEFSFGSCRNSHTARLGRESNVTIRMQNEKEPADESLIPLCKHYHDDFLYGWRIEKVEEENPKWFRWRQGRL